MLKPSDYAALEAIMNSNRGTAVVRNGAICDIDGEEVNFPIARLNMVYALTVIEDNTSWQLVEVSRSGREVLRNKEFEGQLATGFTGTF